MNKLSDKKIEQRDRDVVRFISLFKMKHGGISPTIQEVAGEVGLRSKSQMLWYVNDMEKRGLLKRIRDANGRMAARGFMLHGERYIPPE